MPRNISFSMTTPQFLDGTKDVTRRLGWENLKAGDTLRAVKKCMGLKKGEKMEPLGMIRVVSVRQELLDEMTRNIEYGLAECRREGFPSMVPSEFIEFFCRGHTGAFPKRTITRIEFMKIDGPAFPPTVRPTPVPHRQFLSSARPKDRGPVPCTYPGCEATFKNEWACTQHRVAVHNEGTPTPSPANGKTGDQRS